MGNDILIFDIISFDIFPFGIITFYIFLIDIFSIDIFPFDQSLNYRFIDKIVFSLSDFSSLHALSTTDDMERVSDFTNKIFFSLFVFSYFDLVTATT